MKLVVGQRDSNTNIPLFLFPASFVNLLILRLQNRPLEITAFTWAPLLPPHTIPASIPVLSDPTSCLGLDLCPFNPPSQLPLATSDFHTTPPPDVVFTELFCSGPLSPPSLHTRTPNPTTTSSLFPESAHPHISTSVLTFIPPIESVISSCSSTSEMSP